MMSFWMLKDPERQAQTYRGFTDSPVATSCAHSRYRPDIGQYVMNNAFLDEKMAMRMECHGTSTGHIVDIHKITCHILADPFRNAIAHREMHSRTFDARSCDDFNSLLK
jgi:hypothetical protein